MAGAFGGASSFVGTSRESGNASDSSNWFSSNTFGTANFPSSSSSSIVSSTAFSFDNANSSQYPVSSNAFGINSNYNRFDTNSFGITSNSNHNPPAPNVFGNASSLNHSCFAPNSFGNASNSNHNPFAPNSFGNTSSPIHNPFASNASANTSNSHHNPFASNHNLFALNASGNTSISNNSLFAPHAVGNTSNSNNNSFTTNAFGNTSNPSHNPFAPNVFGKASNSNHNPSSASSFGTRTSTYGGLSTGVFGASSASSSTFTFGQPTTFSGPSFMFGTTSAGSHDPFGSTTSRGPPVNSVGEDSADLFGASPASSPTFCRTSTGVFGVPSFPLLTSPSLRIGNASRASLSSTMFGLTSNNSTTASQTTWSNFGKINSSALEMTPAYPIQSSSSATSPSIPTGLLQPICGQNTGSRINSYKITTCNSEGLSCKLLSISAMPFYESKSHEELRWEDYKLKSGGQPTSVNNQAQGTNKQMFEFQLFPSVTRSVSTISPPCIVPDITRKLNTPTFSIPCLSSPAPPPDFPELHNKTPASTGVGYDQVATNTNNQPRQNLQLPSTDSVSGQITANAYSAIHMTHAPCSLTAPAISAGNNQGVSLDIGQSQPSLPQLNLTLNGVKESIIAVKDPFGSECTTSQPSTGLYACSFRQHGTSSMPVANKPEKTRVSSVLTSRHHSLKPLAVSVRKYRPKSDVPKVPFFDRLKETQNTSKAYSYIMPRENPRAAFAASSELTLFKEETSLLIHASAKEYEYGTDNSKKEQINGSTPNSPNNHFAKGNAKEGTEHLIPKLQRSDYYTEPDIKKLASFESNNPGFCCHVKDFVVGRYGYGWLKFYGETNVRGLDLDSLIHFKNHEVIVYDDDCEKPPVGQGLNKAAEVTLLNIKCIDKKTGKQYISGKMVDNFIEKLKKVVEKQGAEFVAYEPVNGEWKFRVQHF